MNNAATVYVPLLNEGVDAWRPVQAEHVGGDVYRLTGQKPDGESWPFAVGDLVRCKERTLSGEWARSQPVLVAYAKSTVS